MNNFFLIFFVSFFSFFITDHIEAQSGHDIKIQIEGYDYKDLVIGYYYGNKQLLKDSLKINKEGVFEFKGDTPLDAGVYLVIMQPDNNIFQLFIDKEDQRFSIKTTFKKPVENAEIVGSKNNSNFYDYLKFISKQRVKVEAISKQLKVDGLAESKKKKLQGELKQLNEEVVEKQNKIIKSAPKSISALIIRCGQEVSIPGFDDLPKTKRDQKRYQYYKEHWFDNMDLSDDRLIKTPIMFPKVEQYFEKMIAPAPDSINKEIDYILAKMNPKGENFKYFLVSFLNKYAKSKYVGMDAVYVHLVNNYYDKGFATWTEEEQLAKIVENAATLEPLLIGKIAPGINMPQIDVEGTLKVKDEKNEHKRFKIKSDINLLNVSSKYTILFIWDPDCGHCKKSMPLIIDFYNKYKKKVQIYAVCNKTYKDLPACAQFIKDKMPVTWLNMVDPYIRSNYKKLYDVKSTPQIYILDENKKIISKKVGAEQLGDIIDRFEEFEKQNQ